MKKPGKIEQVLDLLTQPAFTVMHGRIMHTNQAAKNLHIVPETPVQELMLSDYEEYKNFTGGCLTLTLQSLGSNLNASITRNGKTDIFVLQDLTENPVLTALARSGLQLRQPLSNILTILDSYESAGKGKKQNNDLQTAQLKKNAMQMLSNIINMSDVGSWIERGVVKESCNICSLFQETMEKCSNALSAAKVYIKYTCSESPIYTSVNAEMLERAIYNMISNAAKFSVPEVFIEAALVKDNNKVRISVQSTAPNAEKDLSTISFNSFLRQPSLEDSHLGIGLGMTLIRSAALAHKGTVLIDIPQPNKIRVSMTLSITPHTPSKTLRSPVLRLSNYAGGLDLALLEFADILPAECYNQKLL